MFSPKLILTRIWWDHLELPTQSQCIARPKFWIKKGLFKWELGVGSVTNPCTNFNYIHENKEIGQLSMKIRSHLWGFFLYNKITNPEKRFHSSWRCYKEKGKTKLSKTVIRKAKICDLTKHVALEQTDKMHRSLPNFNNNHMNRMKRML